MIEFYRPVNCPTCADIEAALQELVVAHKVIVVETDQVEPELGNVSLPAFKENGHVISGQEAIRSYLQELEGFVANWRRFQSDACYIDDEGETC
jgi:glutaredoxin